MHDFARLANTLLKDEESLLGDKKIRKTELQVQQSGNFCAAWPQGCMTRQEIALAPNAALLVSLFLRMVCACRSLTRLRAALFGAQTMKKTREFGSLPGLRLGTSGLYRSISLSLSLSRRTEESSE